MTQALSIRNRQRVRAVETRLLRRVTLHVLTNELHLPNFELGLHLVAAEEMARVNSTFLQHEGSTDVITFDHGDGEAAGRLHGEIFICLGDAVTQARQFRTTWQQELARYVIHGILHLRGHDDLDPQARRSMKREEKRLLREVGRRFDIDALAKSPQR
jgi:probable rRNA maturation factor